MQRNDQANIDRFDLLLQTETDPIKRANIRLHAREKAEQLKASVTGDAAKAY